MFMSEPLSPAHGTPVFMSEPLSPVCGTESVNWLGKGVGADNSLS